MLGLLRNSAAFLTAPLSGGSLTNGCARMNDVHNSVKGAPDGRSPEQKSLPVPELAPSGCSPHLMSSSRPVLLANVREFTVDRTAKQRSATVPTADPQAERDKTAPDVPFMDGGSEMDASRSFQAALASAIENAIQAETQQVTEQKFDAQLCDLLDRRCKESCSHIEGRLNFFYDQTAMRLDALSDQIVKKVCESLSQQAAATLNAVVVASAQQSKSALSAESKHALEGFGRQISELSEAHLEAHRKEVQVLSSNLQLRLRRVAYTLEDVAAAEMPRS